MKFYDVLETRLLSLRSELMRWKRHIAKALLAAMFVVPFIGIVLLLLPLIRGDTLHYIYFGGDLRPLGDELTIALEFRAPDFQRLPQRDEFVSLYERIWQVRTPETFSYEGERICLDSIQISDLAGGEGTYPAPYGGQGGGIGWISGRNQYSESFDDSACFSRDERLDQPLPHEHLERSHAAIVTTPDYFFPFDRFTLPMEVWVSGTLMLDESTSLPVRLAPRVIGFVNSSSWDVSGEVRKNVDDAEPSTIVLLEFRRPLIHRVLTPLILFLLAISIFLLPRIKELGGFLRASMGFVFGLWGTREILIPNYVTWPTIIEPWILTLYALLAVSMFRKLVIRPLWNIVGNEGVSDEEDSVGGV